MRATRFQCSCLLAGALLETSGVCLADAFTRGDVNQSGRILTCSGLDEGTIDRHEEFAKRIEALIAQKDGKAFDALVDVDSMLAQATRGLAVPPQNVEDFKKGFKRSFSLSKQIFGGLQNSGTYSFLRLRRVDGRQQAVFRVNMEGGINYRGGVRPPLRGVHEDSRVRRVEEIEEDEGVTAASSQRAQARRCRPAPRRPPERMVRRCEPGWTGWRSRTPRKSRSCRDVGTLYESIDNVRRCWFSLADSP